MSIRLLIPLAATACAGSSPVVIDSAEDAPICVFDAVYHCDYRTTGIYASCTEYSLSAQDYLDAQSIKSTGNGLSDSCTNNGATWSEGGCPVDDTWVGVCVSEVGGTIGLVYGTHYYSEPELVLPDGSVILYDDASASEICAETEGSEWCNDGRE